ncbi:MAG: ketopantoate reductase family protein [Spirochaetales bacterium]
MQMHVAVIGAGAVGAAIVSMMLEAGVDVTVVADAERARRLRDEGLLVNGSRIEPRILSLEAGGPPSTYTLSIIATKSTGLQAALPLVARAAGEAGLVMSLLNGISSEDAIREALGPGAEKRVVPAMILGIDATREGNVVRYLNRGTIHFGADAQSAPVHAEAISQVADLFEASGIPYAISENITRTLWWKFMINVGINQASAILRAPYGLFQESDHARALMSELMDEAVELSKLEGTGLAEADIDAWLETLSGLDPTGKTSMVQDVEAGRPTELDLFAGTVLGRAKRHGLATPVNRTVYHIIRGLEAQF